AGRPIRLMSSSSLDQKMLPESRGFVLIQAGAETKFCRTPRRRRAGRPRTERMSRSRILVVDDSPLLRQVLADAFPPDRYEIDAASDGVEALRRIRDARPDLIVSDILMPRMDGWALCEEVRRDPATRSIPFIFLTAERQVPKRIKGLEMGADDYMVKPFAK